MSAVDDTVIPDHGEVALSVPDVGDADDSGELQRPGGPVPEAPDEPDPTTDSTEGEAPSETGEEPAPPSESESSTPTTTRPSEPSSTPAQPQSSVENEVVDIANAHRAAAGCEPLRVDARLAQAAADHSADMSARDYFDHTTPDDVTFAERIVSAGFAAPGAENIARGQQTAAVVMQSWMDSDGHRANILNCRLTAIGVGLETEGMYWTQDFGF